MLRHSGLIKFDALKSQSLSMHSSLPEQQGNFACLGSVLLHAFDLVIFTLMHESVSYSKFADAHPFASHFLCHMLMAIEVNGVNRAPFTTCDPRLQG